MKTTKYALLIGDGNGDGHVFRELEPGEENNLVQVMEDHGFSKFIEKHEDDDPNYWSDEEAVLIRYEVIIPKEKKVVTELVIED